MLSIIILIISFVLDGILTNYLPFLPNCLSLFTPLLTLTAILVVYPLYRKKESKYYLTIIITGFLYDLFYTNLLFLNAILFFLCGLLISFLYKNIGYSFIKIIFLTIVPITFTKVLYKITHSLLLNIIFACMFYSLIEIIPKKYKRIYLN